MTGLRRVENVLLFLKSKVGRLLGVFSFWHEAGLGTILSTFVLQSCVFFLFLFYFLNSLYFIQKEEKETKSGLTFRLTTKNLCLSWARLYIELAWECRVRGYCKSAQKSARSSGFSLLPFFAKKLLSITSPVDAMLLVALYGTLHHRHSFSTKVVWFGLSWTI